MRAVVDTNVWISAALNPRGFCGPIVELVESRAFTPVTCALTLREISLVLTREWFLRRYGITPAEIARLLRVVTQRSLQVPDPEVIPMCRDPRDDVFVSLAVASGAQFLVTRDDDLKRDLAVARHLADADCQVMSVRQFLELMT